jgi:hypothetical protein
MTAANMMKYENRRGGLGGLNTFSAHRLQLAPHEAA